MGKRLPKRGGDTGTTIPSGKDVDFVAILTAIGALVTGMTNIDNSTKLTGQTKTQGAPKPGNKGLLGILTKMSQNLDVIIGRGNKSLTGKPSKNNTDNLKSNLLGGLLTDKNKEFFKDLPNLLSNINKSLSSAVDNMTTEGKGKKEEIDIEVSGGGDFEKLLDSFKNFNLAPENKESIEELSIMTKKDGALSSIFENVDRLEGINPNFEEFSKQLKGMGNASSEAVAVGNGIDKESIQAAMENFGEIAKVILALCAVGIVLLIVGLLAKHIDFKGILMFVGMLMLFLAGIAAVFILASKYMQSGSEVSEGIKQYIALVAVAAVIMIVGAMFNSMIPFKDVIMFAFKLGFFLLMLTGIFLIWNKLKGEVASGIKDAVITVGLAAFILFLGAASFKALDVGSLLKFIFFLGVFLFGIVIVLLAMQIALKVGGNGDPTGPMREALTLVVGAAFIMFLGAACYKALGPGAIIGFITLFDIFIGSLIAIITPLIKSSSMFNEGAEVLRSVAVFVAIAAAVMLIGGGLIAKFPALLITIPLFTFLLDFFIASLTLVLTPLIAASGIFFKGNEVMESVGKFVATAAAAMSIGGLLIVFFPDLLWAIPSFIVLMDIMIGGMMYMMVKLTKKLDDPKKALTACLILEVIKRAVKGVATSFLILSIAAAIISQYGGEAAFMIIVGCLIATVTSLLGMMVYVSKNLDEQKAARAIVILNSIVSALMTTSIAFVILGVVYAIVMKSGGIGGFLGLVTMVVSVLAILSLGIVGLAWLLGNGIVTEMAYLAIGVVIAAASAFAIVAAALVGIAVSLKILSTIKSFDMTPLINGVVSLIGLTTALAPLALASPIILTASIALTALTIVISKMAQAVKEYAELKISVYEGTKHVGYRNLTTKDFDSAAKNVALIITTLTKGIMQAYEEHPEWYGATGLITLFENSLNGGQTPLERVIRQSKLLAPLISEIAEAVKDYADLKIKTYEGTKHSGYRYLKKKDFRDAAQNISLVITTLTEGIMLAYEEHPEWYGATLSLSSFVDWATGNSDDGTPLERVIKHNMKLAPLISKIGEAIGEIANLKFATKWNEKGSAIAYKQMKSPDFQKASDNIVKVITTMSEGIMEVYEKHPDWYGTGGHSFSDFMGSLFTNAFNDGTPMERVIAHDLKLSKLISKIADSIKDYAELKVPIKWNEQGNVIAYRSIKGEDFTNAGDNIVKVMTTLSYGLMTVYQEHPEWYENTGFFGSGDTPMEKVISTDTKLSKLISNVAASVKDYAELLIPIDWDKQSGKAIKFRAMKPEDFTAAGENIGLVVTSAALGLMGYHSDGTATPYKATIEKYLMKDANDDQEEFERLLENSQKIGTIISGMADGISKYAKMLVPDEWDRKTGTPIHYSQMDSTMMKDAGEGIGKIITGVADALITAYNKNKAMFGWNEAEQEFDSDSPIQHVIDSCVNMGKVISGIAEGVTKFAEMKVPTDWDKTGKPTNFKKIGKEVFTDAGDRISEILTTIGGTMAKVYSEHPEMFTIRMKKEGGFLGIGASEVPAEEMTPFEKVVDASVKMGTVIGSIAQALQIFADQKAIGKDANGQDIIVGITDATMKLAQNSITNILTTVADTFEKLSKGPKAKLFASESMDTIVEAVGKMMTVVGTMSTSLQNLAMLKIPIAWDEKGEPTGFRQMAKPDFDAASENIQIILSAVGNAFMNIANDPRNSWIVNSSETKSETRKFLGKTFFENTTSSSSTTAGKAEGIAAVLDGMSTLATILSVMSGCIYGYATMRFPMGTNKDGKVQYSDPITLFDLITAKININNVASTLAEAMYMIMNNDKVSYLASEEGSKKMENTSSTLDTIISSISSMIDDVKGLTENEASKAISNVSKDLKRMIDPLTSIINEIADILSLLFSGNEKYGKASLKIAGKEFTVQYSFAELMNKYKPMFDATGNSFENFINSILKIVESLGNIDKPLNESYTKINSLHNLFENEQYIDKLRSIISNIGFMLQDMRKISQFDNLFISQATSSSSFGEDVYNFFNSSNLFNASASRQMAQTEIDNIVEKLAIYSDLILRVTNTLKKINSNVSNVKMANYSEFNNSIVGFFNAIRLVRASIGNISKEQSESIAGIMMSYSYALSILIDTAAKTSTLGDANFEVLTDGIISINESISNINENALKMFRGQTTQLEKFVKSVNTIKLLNISSLNKFVTSLNQLANKMGNLDKLTEAIANKLSGVLEKLVQRLVHAEQTIVKADEIQKRRHELIQKSVKEVSELMKQPMTIEVQATSTGSQETPAGGDASANGQNGSNTPNSTTTNR